MAATAAKQPQNQPQKSARKCVHYPEKPSTQKVYFVDTPTETREKTTKNPIFFFQLKEKSEEMKRKKCTFVL